MNWDSLKWKTGSTQQLCTLPARLTAVTLANSRYLFQWLRFSSLGVKFRGQATMCSWVETWICCFPLKLNETVDYQYIPHRYSRTSQTPARDRVWSREDSESRAHDRCVPGVLFMFSSFLPLSKTGLQTRNVSSCSSNHGVSVLRPMTAQRGSTFPGLKMDESWSTYLTGWIKCNVVTVYLLHRCSS